MHELFSLKNKAIVTKDKKGNPSSYKLIIDVKLDLIDKVITNIDDQNLIDDVNQSVQELCKSFPLYNELHN